MSWSLAEEQFAKTLPGYESRAQQQRLATTIEAGLAAGEILLAQAGTGCIQGDAEIIVNRAGIGRRMTLRDLVVRFNGGRTESVDSRGRRSVQPRPWDLAIPTFVQREVDGVVRLGELQNAWFSGVKTTYTVTTDSGRTVRATDEHPFFTDRGWLRLDELLVGDEVHVRGEQAVGVPRQPKPHYRTRSGLKGHPYAGRRTATMHKHRVPLHRLVAEATMNGMIVESFIDRVRVGDVEGLAFIDPAVYAVHHIDHDHLNNDPGNLKVMTHEEHHRLHAAEGKTNSVLFKVVSERVISVERFGEEETYDIEVADDPHNFIVNGFVVHNTGKSLAGLVPAIDHAMTTGMPVIVATATKALQDQYAGKDLPFLQEHLGTQFDWAVLKGRGNYVCRAKLNTLTPDDVFGLRSLVEELEAGDHSGDLDEVITEIDPRDRPKLVSTSDECPGKHDCPFGKVCFAEAAKAKAKESDVIVVNHALLVTDLQIRSQFTDVDGNPVGMLPEYGAVVVDEAHELEDYATSMLGETFSQKGLTRLGTEVTNFTGDKDIVGSLNRSATRLFTLLDDRLAQASKDARNVRLTGTDLLDMEDSVSDVLDTLRNAWHVVNGAMTDGDDGATGRKKRLKKRLGRMGEKLTSILVAEEGDLVRWIERDEKRGTVLAYAPLHVGPFLREHLWSMVPGVLLSATLAFGSDFSYVAGRLGIDSYRDFDAGTPFDYPKQAALFVPTDMDPSPATKAKWSAMCGVTMTKLVRAAGGRTLLLFTSKRAMNEAYDVVAPALEDLGLQVLRQGDRPNRVLAAEFKLDETSVLFALKSFMTGVDIQGDALRLVIIDKLPFPVPTDVIWSARCDAVDAVARNKWVDGAFPALTVPAMALTLLQAFGRLIRTKADRGMVAILDSRLHTKNYGKKMLRNLPPAQRITTTADAVAYLEDIES